MKDYFKYYKKGFAMCWHNKKYSIPKKILITIMSIVWYPIGYFIAWRVEKRINNKYAKQGFDMMNDIFRKEMNK